MRRGPGRVVLVAPDADGLSAADDPWLTHARSLREAGADVHLLSGGARIRTGRALGLDGTVIDDVPLPAEYRVAGQRGPSPFDASDRVRLALERLHRDLTFDQIEFSGRGGLGLRTIQAKRAGLAFDDVSIIVRLDDASAWQRHREHRWPSCPDELQDDFAERYCWEMAEDVEAPCPEVLEFVRRIGWETRVGGEVTCEVGANAKRGRDGEARPLVTVGIAHYNLGAFLPETLASLAAQSYPAIDVVVIDDGSTDPASRAVFDQMEALYPRSRFLRQENAGIGATRNRALAEARGDYFLPMDADNIARPDMVERFVNAMERQPDVSGLSCYFLAFRETEQLTRGEYAYAERPVGGPHVLACIRNVYGDANAIFRTAALRAVGGYETDRGTSYEDWELFVKLANAGHRLGVVPEHLFFYRHRDAGFSRATDPYPNHQRVLRQFFRLEQLPPAERVALWTALLGFERRREELAERERCLRYRLADRLHAWGRRLPRTKRLVKGLLTSLGL